MRRQSPQITNNGQGANQVPTSIFLITSDTFKKSFLGGDDQLDLVSDQNIWATLLANDGKFLPTIDRIADVSFKFNNDQRFKFGSKAGMKLGISASAVNQIHLIGRSKATKTTTRLRRTR